GSWAIFATRDGRAQEQTLHVSPAAIALDNPEATQQVLVRSAKLPTDLTRLASYEVLDPKVAAVDAYGLVQPKTEGRTVLVVRHGQELARISVDISGLKTPAPVSFETQIMPILTRGGC